ncbi:MAG: Ferredoxin--NADP reductase [Alphaproteobacteria bacterium UBA4588]|nr:MAG: Ferredoxin--NADP reductase [Alphaproteobacteria bacterium UBA4588]
MSQQFDVVIIGAGAAGLMCAFQAGQRGLSVLLIDHARKLAEKIRISGGGRCNFTNIYARPEAFLCQNPHFVKSALARYTAADFIDLVTRHDIPFHEKKLGQLFCDRSAQDIIDMLIENCHQAGVTLRTGCAVTQVTPTNGLYEVVTESGHISATSLVIATGGLSIPKIGATGFGYDIARQFGLALVPQRAGLVPLTFTDEMKQRCAVLSGLSVDALVSAGKTEFEEGMLFTHRGLSGPSILQISSYWRESEQLTVNLAPEHRIGDSLKADKKQHPKQTIHTALSQVLPKRLAADILASAQMEGRLADCADKQLAALGDLINDWHISPSGTEGYRTAEVTLGGVDTDALDARTMQARSHEGLYFIGEVVDVTGHLGGYNFQWAWSSGYICAEALAAR